MFNRVMGGAYHEGRSIANPMVGGEEVHTCAPAIGSNMPKRLGPHEATRGAANPLRFLNTGEAHAPHDDHVPS